jgi:hypothetical protein
MVSDARMQKQLCVLVFVLREGARVVVQCTTSYTFAVLQSFPSSLVSRDADDVV